MVESITILNIVKRIHYHHVVMDTLKQNIQSVMMKFSGSSKHQHVKKVVMINRKIMKMRKLDHEMILIHCYQTKKLL